MTLTKRKLSFNDDSERLLTTPEPIHTDVVDAAEALTQLHTVTPLVTPPPPQLPSVHPLILKVLLLLDHPIVLGAVKYYELLKRAYPHFNYAAKMVERAAAPVVNKIEVNLNSRHQSRMEAAQVANFQQLLNERSTPQAVKKRRLLEDLTASHQDMRTVSTETRKRLQFCLHILKLANDNINDKVHYLHEVVSEREKICEQRARLASESRPEPEGPEVKTELDEQPPEQEAKLEIVTTVKKIIHLISNFKPLLLLLEPLLPVSLNQLALVDSQLKLTIRDIILNLPLLVSLQPPQLQQGLGDRIFVFAKELLEMIGKLTLVLNQQLEMAELWIGDEEPEDDGFATPRAHTPGNTPGATTPGPVYKDLSRADSQLTLATALLTPPKRISIDDLTQS